MSEKLKPRQKLMEVQEYEAWLREHGYERVLLPYREGDKAFRWYMKCPDGRKIWHIYPLKGGSETVIIESNKGLTIKMNPRKTQLKVKL